MDFRRKTHALVVGLGAAATHAEMSEFEFSACACAIASVTLEVVAELILVELVDEVAAKLVREFQKVVEVLVASSCRARGRPWFATVVTARTTFPSVSPVPFPLGGTDGAGSASIEGPPGRAACF